MGRWMRRMLNALEKENPELKKMYAEAMLGIKASTTSSVGKTSDGRSSTR